VTAPDRPPVPTVAVVGGGITGLAAAHALTRSGGSPLEVVVLEGSPEIGGKLRVVEVAGLPLDAGAEALLARRPEAVSLAREVGLGPDVVQPATTQARVWSRGRLHPLPAGQVMGVPADLRALASTRLLRAPELARIPLDTWLPRTRIGADVSVGSYVGRRLGRAVVDRLVEPLLGGVYAGSADRLSFAATVPGLFAAALAERSLLVAAQHARALGPGAGGPVFAGIRGGVGRLPAAVAAASAATVRTSATVRRLERTATGWRLVLGSAAAPETLDVDAVVLAVPAQPAARLLATVAPGPAAELGHIDYASVALVTYVLPAAAVPRLPPGSGLLVPPVERRVVKAVTFSSAKWDWVGAGRDVVVVRASVGRHGEERDLQRDDADLAQVVLGELAELAGVTGSPLDARVSRWGGSLPQYAVGHLARVVRVRAALAATPTLALAGAAYDGIGIPACIASAREAAAQVRRALAARGE
jgi:protoporphyrinogen/coproporphyrinogen III oxidase